LGGGGGLLGRRRKSELWSSKSSQNSNEISLIHQEFDEDNTSLTPFILLVSSFNHLRYSSIFEKQT
jgi:hypothetical protein